MENSNEVWGRVLSNSWVVNGGEREKSSRPIRRGQLGGQERKTEEGGEKVAGWSADIVLSDIDRKLWP